MTIAVTKMSKISQEAYTQAGNIADEVLACKPLGIRYRAACDTGLVGSCVHGSRLQRARTRSRAVHRALESGGSSGRQARALPGALHGHHKLSHVLSIW